MRIANIRKKTFGIFIILLVFTGMTILNEDIASSQSEISSLLLSSSAITSNSVSLNWTKTNISDFKNYTIYISQDNKTFRIIQSITDINITVFEIFELQENTKYYFKVGVYNSSYFNESNVINITTTNGRPTAVIVSIKKITAIEIKLFWSRNNDNDFSRYEIHGSEEERFIPSKETLIDVINDRNLTTYTVKNLTEGKDYHFKVRVYDLYGLYSDSDIVLTKIDKVEKKLTEIVAHIVILLAVIILSAKVCGEFFERYLKMPSVLGELIAGMIIGPFALGGYFFFINEMQIGPLFDGAIFSPEGGITETNIVIYAIAQLGAIVLLFVAGLETDPKKFFSAGITSTFVAIGGVALPFMFGYFATLYYATNIQNFEHPQIEALFMGAVLTATSVGITARVLSDIKKLNTKEGVTILCSAVIDDIIGIIVLVIVVAIATTTTGHPLTNLIVNSGVSLNSTQKLILDAVFITIIAVAFWLALLFFGLKFSKQINNALKKFKTPGALFGIAMVFVLFFSFLAEAVGLAMIIGAYAIGLALSKTEISRYLLEKIYSLYHTIVPIFFVVMGMLVDFSAMAKLTIIVFGTIITILAIIGKIVGCSIPALLRGYSSKESIRVGVGMVPRGEVALIVASYALVAGAITSEIYGVAIMMTAITTLLVPIWLIKIFKEGKEEKELSGLSEK